MLTLTPPPSVLCKHFSHPHTLTFPVQKGQKHHPTRGARFAPWVPPLIQVMAPGEFAAPTEQSEMHKAQILGLGPGAPLGGGGQQPSHWLPGRWAMKHLPGSDRCFLLNTTTKTADHSPKHLCMEHTWGQTPFTEHAPHLTSPGRLLRCPVSFDLYKDP